jgi:ribosomal-protein-alanine N-acetyltransferase
MQAIRIESDRLIIFTVQEHHCSMILDYITENKDFFTPWIPKVSDDYYSTAHQLKLIKDDHFFLKNLMKIKFYIIKKESPLNIIADFSYSNIILGAFKSCYLGYKQASKECGHGYMFEAISRANQFVFEELKLNRIEANIIPRNESSVSLIKKLGFVQEGYSKKYLKINDVWEDHVRFAKLNEHEV